MGKKLYVGNLAHQATEADLKELFAQAGLCESVAIITDRNSGQSRGFGFVEMASNDDAQKAIGMFNGQDLKGRALTVNEARERQSGGSRPGNNDRGGGWNRRY